LIHFYKRYYSAVQCHSCVSLQILTVLILVCTR